MLELPGIMTSGDAGQDVQKILRYLSKLVPQLEMELMNAQQDGYLEQYNAATQGIGAVNDKTTAGALVAHEQRTDNPHRVTAEQLGLTLGRLVKLTLTDGGLVARIGEKRGLQINIQDVTVTINAWGGTGSIAYRSDVNLGEWAEKIPILYYTGITMRGGTNNDYWAGPVSGSDSENIGTMRIYHNKNIEPEPEPDEENESPPEVVVDPTEDEREIRMTVIGMGVFGYGEQ